MKYARRERERERAIAATVLTLNGIDTIGKFSIVK